MILVTGATGNVATEVVAWMLDGMGIETGIDLPALAAAGWSILRHLGREPTSKVSRALAARRPAPPCGVAQPPQRQGKHGRQQ